jgi:hypothetical protein
VFSRRGLQDQRFWKFHAPWALVHIAIIFICLGGKQRYYLIIFPLLLIALIRGFLRMPAPWNWIAAALPALFLYISIPLAIENHRGEAPPIRLVRYLEQLYPPSRRKNVALLFVNVRRHSEWYAPEFKTFVISHPRATCRKSWKVRLPLIQMMQTCLCLPGGGACRLSHFGVP